jgi:hypothetical protein
MNRKELVMRSTLVACSLWLIPLFAACGDDGGTSNENEVFTTVTLTFTPQGPGTPVIAAFDDPDGDGGAAPTIDPIRLAAASMYTMAVTFENRLESPPEDITAEVADEADEHQVFFTGTAVDGPAAYNPGAPLTHTYADQDINGLPIGLSNTIVAAVGTGELTVTLRHLPPVNETPVKTADLAQQVAGAGFSTIGGSTDVQVDFDVTVE